MNDAESRPVVVLVNRAIIANKENKYLLLRRKSTSTNFPNMWEIPGGKLDKGQDATHALEREVMEETGLLVIPTHPVAFVDSFILSFGKYVGLPYVVIIGIARIGGGDQVTITDEHSEYVWSSYQEVLAMELTEETRKAFLALEQSMKGEKR